VRRLCLLLLLAALAAPEGAAEDLTQEQFWELMARRYAENQANLEACPYNKFISDPLARFSRDPDAAPDPADVVVDDTWTIVYPAPCDNVIRVLAERLRALLQDVMGAGALATADAVPSGAPCIVLEASGGGVAGIAESYTLEIAPERITVSGADSAGLRDGIVRLIDLFGFEQAPWLAPQHTVYTPKLKRRMGTFGPEHTILMGNNALMVWAGSLGNTPDGPPGAGWQFFGLAVALNSPIINPDHCWMLSFWTGRKQRLRRPRIHRPSPGHRQPGSPADV